MRQTNGTPKTLSEAILNGVMDWSAESHIPMTEVIRLHVRDYLAQQFTMDLMEEKSVCILWDRITGEKKSVEQIITVEDVEWLRSA